MFSATPQLRISAALPVSAVLLWAGAPSAGAATIASGHADVGARLVDGRLQIAVKDASAGSVVWRRPSTVQIRVGSRASVKVPSANRKIVGASKAWLIPQTQKAGVPWLGWNTEALSSKKFKGKVTWSLTRVSGPGRVAVFQTGSFGKNDVLFSSARRPHGNRKIALGVHAHGNWSFTKAGSYRLTFRMAVRTRGGKVLSDRQALRVKVG